MLTLGAVVAGFALAQAGGPPPVYVVVDKVVLEPSGGAPERIKIHGCFVRLADTKKYEYGKPVEGYVYLSLGGDAATARAEWETWRKAAGTGKVVAVGLCSQAGALLTVSIHKPDERVAKPDAGYTPGHLSAPAEMSWDKESPVQDLLAFAKARPAKTADRRP